MTLSNITKLDSSPPEQKSAMQAKLMDSCQQFEGQFLDMMLQEMRKTVPDDPMLGDDAHEQQIFQGMEDDKIAQDMAKDGAGGNLAMEMYQQLTRGKDGASGASGSALPSAAVDAVNAAKNIIPLLKLPCLGADNEDHDNN
jgi:Rod binding domain-containing protein